jgi:hypothetical protein
MISEMFVIVSATKQKKNTYSQDRLDNVNELLLLLGVGELEAGNVVGDVVEERREEGDLEVLVVGNQLEVDDAAVVELGRWRGIRQCAVGYLLDDLELCRAGVRIAVVGGDAERHRGRNRETRQGRRGREDRCEMHFDSFVYYYFLSSSGMRGIGSVCD